jgi:heme exporter protein B
MTGLGVSRIARMIARKDLAVEWRGKVLVNQVLPFAALVMVMFAFALDGDDVLQRTASGLAWMATVLSMFVVISRSFLVDTEDGALEAMRVAGLDMRGVYLGKSAALFVQLLVLNVVLIALSLLLYHVTLTASSALLLVCVVVAATAGLSFVGVLYGGLAALSKGRETLLPLLVLPVVAPVVIGAARATESAYGTGGAQVGEGWPWVGLLGVFAVAFAIAGLLSFPALIEE